MHYIRSAIAPSTRRTYTPAIENYRNYCEERDWNPDGPITEHRASEWLAALADAGRLSASTIRTYKAALGTHHAEVSTLPNPLASANITRLLTGIEYAKAEREAEKRRLHPKSEPFTSAMLKSIVAHFQANQCTKKERMMLGAIGMLFGAALRPSEALGNGTTRPLTSSQIHFFAEPLDRHPIANILTHPSMPHYVTIELHGSKTNRGQRSEVVVVSSPLCVQLIVAWARSRHSSAEDHLFGESFFQLAPCAIPLRTANLIAFTTGVLNRIGIHASLSGKCFRIGATSEFVAAGIDPADLRDLGRWRTNMWRTYADTHSKRQRAITNQSKL